MLRLGVLIAIAIAFFQCTNEESSLLFNVKDLVGKTENEAQKILGKPDTTYVYPFLSRGYRVHGYTKNGMEVRFLNGSVIEVILRKPENIPFDPASLTLFGLPSATPDFMDTSSTIQWKNVDGIKAINFYKVGKRNPEKKEMFEIYFNLK